MKSCDFHSCWVITQIDQKWPRFLHVHHAKSPLFTSSGMKYTKHLILAFSLWKIQSHFGFAVQNGTGNEKFPPQNLFFFQKKLFLDTLYKRVSFHYCPQNEKSQWRGGDPKFLCLLKGGLIVISKNKIFFQSVEGNFWQFSKKIWTGLPHALPPGMKIQKERENSQKRIPILLH